MRDSLTSRLLLSVAIGLMGLGRSAWADPPSPPPPAGEAEIKLRPLPPISDDPPPHEGAMIDRPYIIEPPDMLLVEVIEALPGRPISGERLVRPDGTISLGFYGSVHVRGLREEQVKEKIVHHLRKILPDDVLGLIEQSEEGADIEIHPRDTNRVFVDVTAYNSKNYYVQGDVAAPGKLPWTGNETVLDAMNYAGGLIPSADPKDIRLVRPPSGGKPARVYPIDLEAITERGEIEKNYQLFPGDRIIVGRNSVVKTSVELDRVAGAMQTVVQYIRLNSAMASEIVKAAAPGGTTTMTPEQRETVTREWADFWWKVVSRPGGVILDEETFREALIRAMNPREVAKPTEKKK